MDCSTPELVMDRIILRASSNSCPLSWWCHLTISSSAVPFSSHLQSFPASKSFPIVSSSHQVAKILEFQHQSFEKYSGLISFRMDCLDFLAVQGTLKSLFQHHSSKATILWRSAFFMVQLSHQYMITGTTIALNRWNFVGKVMSLLFNMLSGLVITFLPRSKHLLISWLQSPSAVQAWWNVIVREWWEPSRSHSLQMSTKGFPCQQPFLFISLAALGVLSLYRGFL